MSATVAKLNILLSANTGALAGDLSRAGGMLKAFASTAGDAGAGAGVLSGLLGTLSRSGPQAAVAVAAVTAAVAAATWSIKLAAEAQQISTAFEVMLGSANKAKTMMQDIRGFAAATPFDSIEIANAAKSLLAFGVVQNQVIPTMRMLGDLSSGLNIPIGEMSELYGKAKVQGRAFMEDINQLTGRGIPIITQLAKNFGVGEEAIRGMVEKGQVGFPQLQAALFELTKEGSKFGGMMGKQADTLLGQLSTFWDNIKIAATGVGSQFIGVLTDMMKIINGALDRWNRIWGNTPASSKIGSLDMGLIAQGMKPAGIANPADDAARALADLQKQGEAFTRALRTPFEIIHDNVAEAHRLLEAGVISADIYSRALAKAREELAGQARSAREIREQLSAQMGGPVAALQFGTQAAISGLAAAQRESKLQADTSKAILAENQKFNAKADKLIRAIERKQPTNIKEVSL